MCDCCKEKKEKFYITTPIYYPSDKLHIGHTYCTVATDAMARYKRLRGYDVMFLTGTDEHGQKIENRAKEAGITPKQFVDQIVEGERGVLDLWKLMNISYDRFIRTTDEYHIKAIQRIFKKMYENGDIYKGKYTGMYCTPCESFWTESQLKDGKCPDCGREVQPAEEEAYFFRLATSSIPVWRICASPARASPGASPWTSIRATSSMCGSTPCSTTRRPSALRTTLTMTMTATGLPTSTLSARRSSASTPSSGPPCS